MTSTEDSDKASIYYRRKLQVEVEWQSLLSDVDIYSPEFTVYTTEQKVGDLVLVPRRSLHQVINRGGLTIKVAWSRMTLLSLYDSIHYELPIYQRQVSHLYLMRINIIMRPLQSLSRGAIPSQDDHLQESHPPRSTRGPGARIVNEGRRGSIRPRPHRRVRPRFQRT